MPPPGSGFELSEEDRALLVGWIGGAPLPGGGTGAPSDDDTGGDDTEGETEDEEIMVQSCDLADIAPSAPDPVEAGTASEQIPPDIGEALTRNCGCHYADPEPTTLAAYTGPLDIATWAGFHEEHPFVLCESDLAHECVRERLLHETAPMPPTTCVLEDGSPITEDDLALLDAWLDAGAPDGTDWEG
jgi:hypothetical protein